MDSTRRSNLSVGLPIDVLLYRTDSLKIGLQYRIDQDDPYFNELSRGWSDALQSAYQTLPNPPWLKST